jgi:predicted XRE-type DNA-binding protein
MRSKDREGPNVYSDLGFSPGLSQELERKSELMVELQNFIKRHGLTQAKAAIALGVTQPRVSQLVNGRLSEFSLDELVRLGERAGLHVKVTIQSNVKREKAIVSDVTAAIEAGVDYVYGVGVAAQKLLPVLSSRGSHAHRRRPTKIGSKKKSEVRSGVASKASRLRQESKRGSGQSSSIKG